MPNHQMTILFGDEGDGHHDITEEYVSGTLYYKDKYIYIYYISAATVYTANWVILCFTNKQ